MGTLTTHDPYDFMIFHDHPRSPKTNCRLVNDVSALFSSNLSWFTSKILFRLTFWRGRLKQQARVCPRLCGPCLWLYSTGRCRHDHVLEFGARLRCDWKVHCPYVGSHYVGSGHHLPQHLNWIKYGLACIMGWLSDRCFRLINGNVTGNSVFLTILYGSFTTDSSKQGFINHNVEGMLEFTPILSLLSPFWRTAPCLLGPNSWKSGTGSRDRKNGKLVAKTWVKTRVCLPWFSLKSKNIPHGFSHLWKFWKGLGRLQQINVASGVIFF